jgi:ABC-2 type transport system permease protein
MKRLFSDAAVIARRDFMATVATPTFLIFLLAPLFMLALAVAGGAGVATMASKTESLTRITAIVPVSQGESFAAADAALRPLYRPEDQPPELKVLMPGAHPASEAQKQISSGNSTAVLFGAPARPHILYATNSDRHARYLAELAEQVARADRASLKTNERASAAVMIASEPARGGKAAQQSSGVSAVIGLFMLTLMLAGQSVGMLAEEKANKVIEILAAAVPLESVFLGKLVGMFGSAMLFVTFWGVLLGGLSVFMPPGTGLTNFHPAVGLPMFITLCAAYFAMAYMLLGAVFLGVGGLAGSMREIQMMSLPITIFQMAMFGISAAAASSPDAAIATFARIFPFSSPFAMAARAATDAALWPHFAALGWQALWVAMTIIFAARLFRMGVLKSGGGWRAVFRLS